MRSEVFVAKKNTGFILSLFLLDEFLTVHIFLEPGYDATPLFLRSCEKAVLVPGDTT